MGAIDLEEKETMKWLNKGHEFDRYAEKLVENFYQKGKKIYLFGAGIIGGEIARVIEKTGCFAGFIDNSREKQGFGVNGTEVLPLEKYLENGSRGIIVITVDTKTIPAIESQLTKAGLIKEKDFYLHREFMEQIFPVLSVYVNHQMYVELAQICLTERCTLKCKKCAHACYAVDAKGEDMSLDMAKKSADSFFSYVDIVKEFVLIGGEPFLYRELGEMITYIGEKYRHQIVMFAITTNGTILPKQIILDLCKKYQVTIHVSNYSAAIPSLEKKYEQLKDTLEKNQVPYTFNDQELSWLDYEFEAGSRKRTEEELTQVFDRCHTPCREIRGSRYYYCVMARSVSDNLNLGVGQEDYLELEGMGQEDQKILLEFHHGFSEKGYLEMCNHCNGKDAEKNPIPAAEQAK